MRKLCKTVEHLKLSLGWPNKDLNFGLFVWKDTVPSENFKSWELYCAVKKVANPKP